MCACVCECLCVCVSVCLCDYVMVLWNQLGSSSLSTEENLGGSGSGSIFPGGYSAGACTLSLVAYRNLYQQLKLERSWLLFFCESVFVLQACVCVHGSVCVIVGVCGCACMGQNPVCVREITSCVSLTALQPCSHHAKPRSPLSRQQEVTCLKR